MIQSCTVKFTLALNLPRPDECRRAAATDQLEVVRSARLVIHVHDCIALAMARLQT